MIETPLAIFNINALAAEAHDSETRLAGFVMGTNDLAKETRRAHRAGPRADAVVAVRAACWRRTPTASTSSTASTTTSATPRASRRECAQARDMGFDGKTLIHPNQIEPCNGVFSPSADEVAQARKLIAAFDLPENKGKGVVQIDGRMVERMHADMARRTVAIADALEAAIAAVAK